MRAQGPGDHGHEPTGLYEVLSGPTEVVLVWATSVRDQVQLRKDRDTSLGLSDEGTADERIVTVGQTVDVQVEISNGLKAGERVATTNVAQLTDGAKVS